MADPEMAATIGPGSRELARQLRHYEKQKDNWMLWHYSTKVVVITFGAAIPIMTTINAWPWTIAIAGGVIAVLESIAQLWKFHDRYVSARVLQKGLEKERILFEGRAGEYAIDDQQRRDMLLVESMAKLLETDDSQVISALKGSAFKDGTDTP
jgi:hypothetical protein